MAQGFKQGQWTALGDREVDKHILVLIESVHLLVGDPPQQVDPVSQAPLLDVFLQELIALPIPGDGQGKVRSGCRQPVHHVQQPQTALVPNLQPGGVGDAQGGARLFSQGFGLGLGQLEIDGDVLLPVREPLTQFFRNGIAYPNEPVDTPLAPGHPAEENRGVAVDHRDDLRF